jgi:hypothetical protein
VEGRIEASAARGEGVDWSQALGSHDSLLQLAGPRALASSAHQAGVGLALQQLDLGHVLGAYLAGVGQGQQEGAQVLDSLQVRGGGVGWWWAVLVCGRGRRGWSHHYQKPRLFTTFQ